MALHGLILNVTQYPYLSRPLGGHRIAHFLREQGWDIEVIDWANWWSTAQLQELFRSRVNDHTVFIGFSHLFSIWTEDLDHFAGWVKQNYPNIHIISGSAVNPMFQSLYIDWYVQGFGEQAILHLLRYFAGNGDRPKFHLLGNKRVINAIDDYPAFPMKSLMVRYEDRDFIHKQEWLTIELSRGCKFQCSFCQFPVLGIKEDTSRDQADFALQLQDAYDRFGVTSYMISDETVNDRTEKISKFADVVERLNFNPWFSAYIRLDLMAADSRQKPEMIRMNLRGHFYGIESMNTPSARSIGKGMSSEKIKKELIAARDFFQTDKGQYRGHVGLIAGLPYETENTLHDALDWLIENWQQQSFGIHPLILPSSTSVAKQSKMSKNIMSYGYSQMPNHLADTSDASLFQKVRELQKKGNYLEMGEEILWQNQHMNIFDARRIVHDMYEIKMQHDFRPGPFMINYNLTKSKTISELLSLTFTEYDSLLRDNVSSYIYQKLNWDDRKQR